MNAVRRLVSGKKSRMVDEDVGVDLDLCLLTDRIVLMGYPASGLEGLYRNKREDVKKWLEARYGCQWLIFNFCPRQENGYDADYFDGRVRRFPFPDHHPPPLSLVPLFVQEIKTFLGASEDNVAVIHCRAGKGRTGTLAICYLLSLPNLPEPPHHASRAGSISSDAYLASRKQTSASASEYPSFEDERTRSGAPINARSNRASLDLSTSRSGSSTPSARVALDMSGLRGAESQDKTARNANLLATNLLKSSPPDDHDDTSASESPSSPAILRGAGDGPPKLAGHDALAPASRPEQASDMELSDGMTIEDQEELLKNLSPAQREAALLADKIKFLFHLHATQRMADPGITYGVSIPSQRRWIRYWGQVLTTGDPRATAGSRTVEILRVTVVMSKEVIQGSTLGNKVAVQVSRYKDSFVDDLKARNQALERSRRASSEGQNDADSSSHTFSDDQWDDKNDLVVPFASFGPVDSSVDKTKEETGFERNLGSPGAEAPSHAGLAPRVLKPVRIYANSGGLPTNQKLRGSAAIADAGGVTIGGDRELQFKIVLGSTGSRHGSLPDVSSLGYLWFIPAFHAAISEEGVIRTSFPKDEVDFRKKQAKIENVEIAWRWLPESRPGE